MLSIKSLRTKTSVLTLIPTTIVIVVAGIIALYAYEQVARNVVQERDTELARISARVSLRKHHSANCSTMLAFNTINLPLR